MIGRYKRLRKCKKSIKLDLGSSSFYKIITPRFFKKLENFSNIELFRLKNRKVNKNREEDFVDLIVFKIDGEDYRTMHIKLVESLNNSNCLKKVEGIVFEHYYNVKKELEARELYLKSKEYLNRLKYYNLWVWLIC